MKINKESFLGLSGFLHNHNFTFDKVFNFKKCKEKRLKK